jgi:Ni,Fe-hydrogenase I cytochrome b subunit
MAMSGERWIFRHSAAIRVTHWINAFCLTILLMSGLQIFNAHPALYLGKQSDFDHPVFSISAERRQDRLVGVTKAFGHGMTTTGVLGSQAKWFFSVTRGAKRTSLDRSKIATSPC